MVIKMVKWLQYSSPETENNASSNGFHLRQLLDACWSFADEVTLSSYFDLILSPRFPQAWERRNEWEEYKAALHPWLVGITISDRWFGYGRGSTKMGRYLYHADEDLKEALCALYQDIFLQEPIGQPAGEIIPWFSDLCLFSHGKLFFGSISHEGEAYLYPLNDEMRNIFSSIEGWEECPWRDERSRTRINAFPWEKTRNG